MSFYGQPSCRHKVSVLTDMLSFSDDSHAVGTLCLDVSSDLRLDLGLGLVSSDHVFGSCLRIDAQTDARNDAKTDFLFRSRTPDIADRWM